MVFGESPLKDVYRRAVWGPWRELLEACPPGWEFRVNRRIGLLVARAFPEKRAQVEENLRRAFPDREDLDEVAAQTFATHFENQYASFAFGRIDADNWSSWLRFEGLEHVAAAMAVGKGLVLLHPHMGPAQLPLCALGAMGWPTHQIGGGEPEIQKSDTGRWATAERHRLEARMPVLLHDGNGFLRTVLRALGRGEIVLTAGDGTGGGKEIGRRVEREVLGQRMKLPVGAIYLAWRSGAPLRTLFTVRDPLDRRRFLSVVGDELPIRRDLPLEAAMEAGADAAAAFLDEVLRAHPGAWHFWDDFAPGRLLA